MNIIEGIWIQSGINSFFLFMNIVFGFFGIAYASKKDYYNYFFIIALIIFLLLKLNLSAIYTPDFYNNLISIIAFPLVLIASPFYKKVLSNKFLTTVYIYLLIIFFTLNLPFISLFSNILIPNYDTQIIYIGGISNILSLALINSSNLKYQKLGKILFYITYIPTLLSLSKWTIPIILFSPFIYFYINSIKKNKKFNKFKFFAYIAIIGGVFIIFIDSVAKNIGYESMQAYLNLRVFKSDVLESGIVEQNQFFGIADGNRFNIYSSILRDYFNQNLFFGLNMNYINNYNVPAHNMIVFYISMLGFFGVIYIIIYLKSLFSYLTGIKDKWSRYIAAFFTIVVLLNFMVGESYGNIILLTFIFINLRFIKSNVLLPNNI